MAFWTALIVASDQEELFLLEPEKKIGEDQCAQKTPNHWEKAFAALDEAIAAARHDPEAAQSLFKLLMWGSRDTERIRRTQALMTEVGIPSTWCHI
jgi:hypothetical protein